MEGNAFLLLNIIYEVLLLTYASVYIRWFWDPAHCNQWDHADDYGSRDHANLGLPVLSSRFKPCS